jgi:hypothetical protein
MMNIGDLMTILLLIIVYALLIAVVAALLKRLGTGQRVTMLLAFVVFGVFAGVMAAWVWPYDSSIYPNLPAVLIADAIYNWAAREIASGSADAHSGIPWLLRIPQIYIWASTTLSGLLGLILQILINRRRHRQSEE